MPDGRVPKVQVDPLAEVMTLVPNPMATAQNIVPSLAMAQVPLVGSVLAVQIVPFVDHAAAVETESAQTLELLAASEVQLTLDSTGMVLFVQVIPSGEV